MKKLLLSAIVLMSFSVAAALPLVEPVEVLQYEEYVVQDKVDVVNMVVTVGTFALAESLLNVTGENTQKQSYNSDVYITRNPGVTEQGGHLPYEIGWRF